MQVKALIRHSQQKRSGLEVEHLSPDQEIPGSNPGIPPLEAVLLVPYTHSMLPSGCLLSPARLRVLIEGGGRQAEVAIMSDVIIF